VVFGLLLATFQTMMNEIFQDLITEGIISIYLDDILIFTNSFEEHCKGTSIHSLTSPVSNHVYMYSPWSLYISNHICTTLTSLRQSRPLVNIPIFDNSTNFTESNIDTSQPPSPTSGSSHMTIWHPPMVIVLPYLEGLVLGGLVL
jgi:hypothetical protein